MKSAIELYVSKKVRELRNQRRWSQERLGDEIHYSASFISNKENLNTKDAFNLDHINALAKAFHCKIWDLLPQFPLDD